MGSKIVIKDISKHFTIEKSGKKQTVRALGAINLEIESGQFYSIVGPSGCGKSTLLNIIAGLLEPDGGQVFIDGENFAGKTHPEIGYVFQDDTLLPWYNVYRNVSLGLRYRNWAKKEIKEKVDWLLKVGQLENFAHAYPFQLSGGMMRRVALLTTLAVDPKILLMDEPFGALDTHTKTRLHDELLRIWAQTKQTIVFVTHDINEAITLSDKVVTMSGSPSSVKKVFEISLPHPRDVIKDKEKDEFLKCFRDIWANLGEEFKHGVED